MTAPGGDGRRRQRTAEDDLPSTVPAACAAKLGGLALRICWTQITIRAAHRLLRFAERLQDRRYDRLVDLEGRAQ